MAGMFGGLQMGGGGLGFDPTKLTDENILYVAQNFNPEPVVNALAQMPPEFMGLGTGLQAPIKNPNAPSSASFADLLYPGAPTPTPQAGKKAAPALTAADIAVLQRMLPQAGAPPVGQAHAGSPMPGRQVGINYGGLQTAAPAVRRAPSFAALLGR